jgi:archaellum biogenesis ATPase FlaH
MSETLARTDAASDTSLLERMWLRSDLPPVGSPSPTDPSAVEQTRRPVSDPSSIIPHDLPEGSDEGSRMIPEGGRDPLPAIHPSTPPPPIPKRDEGCRIISSVDLLERSKGSVGGKATELWGLHIRTGIVTMFVGETSVGKTVFLHNLAYHLATGQEFLGISAPRPLRVLSVDFESYEDIYAEHLASIGAVSGWDFLELDNATRGQDLITVFEKAISEHEYDVVIIDPLMEAFPVRDENDNAQATAQLLAFRTLARSTNAAIVVVHNSGLRKGKSNPKFLGRGATARVDRADVTMNFTRTSETERVLHVVKSRSVNLNERITFRFGGELGYELIDSTSPSQSLVATFQTRILEIVQQEAQEGRYEVERKTLMERLDVAKDSSQEQALDRALTRSALGKLRRVRKGVYSLPPVLKAEAVETNNTVKAEERAGEQSSLGEPEAVLSHPEVGYVC